ncbi:MAG: 3-oxoacid CoA-transferase subunit B [Propionibacteriaceae bacterium]|nr:3-oxoacid CoA-transferase subunit B [Propionibacteriaceae bacterium]
MTAEDRTVENVDRPPLDSRELAARVARDVAPGSYVNLGIGLPTKVADFLDEDAGVTLHTENGMLGMGPYAQGDQIDPELINAGKIPVTELLGASYFHHADAFAMMRGGHIDLCVMGAYQVTAGGDLANWSTGQPDAIPAVGGAMDLAVGAKAIFVMMDLFTKDGQAKLVPSCTYPLTGVACVDRIYSDLAVIDLDNGRAVVWETYGISVDELRSRLDVPLSVR